MSLESRRRRTLRTAAELPAVRLSVAFSSDRTTTSHSTSDSSSSSSSSSDPLTIRIPRSLLRLPSTSSAVVSQLSLPLLQPMAALAVKGVDSVKEWDPSKEVDIELWMNQFDQLAVIYGWTDAIRIAICSVKIVGTNASAYVREINNNPIYNANNPLTWLIFRGLILARFTIRIDHDELQRELGNIRQDFLNHESISNFTARFSKVADKIPSRHMLESTKVSYYYANMDAEIAQEITRTPNAAFHDVVNAALTEEKKTEVVRKQKELVTQQQFQLQEMKHPQRGGYNNNTNYQYNNQNKRKRESSNFIYPSGSVAPSVSSSSSSLLAPVPTSTTAVSSSSLPLQSIVGNNQNNNNDANIQCFNCGQMGHYSYHCSAVRDFNRIASNYHNHNNSGRNYRGGYRGGSNRGRGGYRGGYRGRGNSNHN